MKNKSTTLNYQLSFWEKEIFFQKYDFTIIGAGLVGLNAALRLRELAPKASILVVDRVSVPIGASTRNAGFACIGSITELMDDLNHMDETEVFNLVALRMNGLNRLRKKLGDHTIQYEHLGGYEIFTPQEQDIAESCLARLSFFNKNLSHITGHSQTFELVAPSQFPSQLNRVGNLIFNRAEGQLHPGKMMDALLQKCQSAAINVLGGITIDHIDRNGPEPILVTQYGWSINTRHLIVATNGFSKKLFPDLDIRPARNQVFITQPIPKLEFEGCFHYDRGYYYFRNVGKRILFGGGRILAPEEEATTTFGQTPLIKKELVQLLQSLIGPDLSFEVDQWWSGILGIGKVKKPIIEKMDGNIVAAIRMGGMGVAIGTLVGEKAAELTIGVEI